ncbi:MAG: cysteine--tRNA ligase [Nitrosomonadales bacterium]|jgi:cysteinyl-tRNA synthetase|nr:cysteine--tRNA ligase [Nitrosomonadales bacterium]MBT7120400.1 cysteine--tRNA ligase [Nitrosomonadales bacterium]MBT7689526.1 cysteine--tRNA ligase [Nitrosomonadales bacterium]
MLSVYNTLNNKKEIFKSIEPDKVKMYVCGMTVYDFCHIGHARVLIVFDMITRWLRESGYEVHYVRNITDIDDKIIKKAFDEKVDYSVITENFIKEMNYDAAQLGVISPSLEPKATDHIDEMIEMIEGLINKGFAYKAENNDVFYAVSKFKDYGKLSGKSLKDLIAGSRVEVDKFKDDNNDFVLWKSAKANEPYWESPWGNGRPGWHIECSTMSNKLLGKNFDIHGGGQDLQFPHHENEIAQSEAVNDCQMANYWIHNGFVKIDDEKMSKSLGNFFTIRSVLEKYQPEVVRFFILKAHYRSPLNFSQKNLAEAKQALTKLYLSVRNFKLDKEFKINWNSKFANDFKKALDDDFNTAEAIAILFELALKVNKNQNIEDINLLIKLGNVLGILSQDAEVFLKDNVNKGIDVEKIIRQRDEAKASKDYVTADKLRDDLLENDILIEDTPTGTVWRKK